MIVFFYPNAFGHADNYVPSEPAFDPGAYRARNGISGPSTRSCAPSPWTSSCPRNCGACSRCSHRYFYSSSSLWLDNSPVRSGHYRPLFKRFFWFGLVPCVFVLGYCGGAPAEQPYMLISQLAAAYYFAHFLIILPWVARVEKPLPLPMSITEAVLGKREA